MSRMPTGAPDKVLVRLWTDPLRMDAHAEWCDAGQTIADIWAGLPPEHGALKHLIVCEVNGVAVAPEWWGLVRPKPAAPGFPIVVTFHIPLLGGRGGGGRTRKILASVAAIALITASLYVGGPLAAGATGAKLFALKAASFALAAAGSFAANMALQGLGKPQEQTGGEQKQLGFAGANNEFAPGTGLQRVLGTHKVFPKMVCPPFTVVDGDDQWAYAVYALAGHHLFTDIRIGEALVSGAEDVVTETRPGTAADAHLTLVTDTRIEEQLGMSLSEWKIDDAFDGDNEALIDADADEPIWHSFAAKRDVDAVRLEYLFGNGLGHRSTAGSENAAGVMFRHRMRRVGTATWINLPDMYAVHQREGKGLRLSFEIRWVASIPGTAGNGWVGNGDAGETNDSAKGWADLDPKLTGSSSLATASGDGYTQWEYDGQRVILYLVTGTYPKGKYEFEVKRSWPMLDITYNRATGVYTWNGGTTSDFFTPVLSGGEDHAPDNPNRFNDDAILVSVQSIWNEYPIADDGTYPALLAIGVKNRQLDRVSCVARGMIEGWDGSAWVGPGATSNPAAWYRHVLREAKHNARPVPDALISNAGLVDWHTWCTANGKRVDAVVEEASVEEVLKLIALCGWASPIFAPLHTVTIDRVRPDGPTGMITQRNAAGFSFTKPFPERPHALRVTFQDAAQNYETREIGVFAEGYNTDGSGGLLEATRYEAVTYPGLTSEALNEARAEHDLRWMKYRSRIVTFTQDMEHLEHTKGSLVLVETDILGQEGGRGRVEEVIGAEAGEMVDVADLRAVHDLRSLPGGERLVSSIRIDERPLWGLAEVDLLSMPDLRAVSDLRLVGAQKGVSIRLRDGTIETHSVASYEPDGTIVFTTPFTAAIHEGDLVAMGPLTKTAREMLIWEVAPGRDLTAELAALDYAEAAMYPA